MIGPVEPSCTTGRRLCWRGDPYRALLLCAIDQLNPLTCPATPHLFIEQMEAAGVSVEDTTKALAALPLIAR